MLSEIHRPLSALARRIRPVPGARHGVQILQEAFSRLDRDSGWTLLRRFDGDLTLRLNRATHMGSTIYWHGYYGRNELAVLDRLLEPNMVFVDVGAHIGEFALFAAKRVPRGVVLAIEPVREVFETLAWNLSTNGFAHAQALAVAVGEREGAIELYDGEPSRNQPYVHEVVATRYRGHGRERPVGVVRMTTLDAVVESAGVERLDVIKVDTEGGELDALRGARGCMSRFRPYLILEVSDLLLRSAGHSVSDLLDLLESERYALYCIGDRTALDLVRRLGGRRYGALKALDRASLPGFSNLLCVPQGRPVPW